MTLGELPPPGCIGTICGPMISAGFLGAENGFVSPLRALGPLAATLDVGAGCTAKAAIVEIPLAMRTTSTYLAVRAIEGPTCRRMARLQGPPLAKLMYPFIAFLHSSLAGRCDFFFGRSATIASVVIRSPAIEAAPCSALRTTFVGSMTPWLVRSPYSPV